MIKDKIQAYLPKQGRSPIPRSSTINIRIFGLLKNDGIGEVTFILFYKLFNKDSEHSQQKLF